MGRRAAWHSPAAWGRPGVSQGSAVSAQDGQRAPHQTALVFRFTYHNCSQSRSENVLGKIRPVVSTWASREKKGRLSLGSPCCQSSGSCIKKHVYIAFFFISCFYSPPPPFQKKKKKVKQRKTAIISFWKFPSPSSLGSHAGKRKSHLDMMMKMASAVG